MKRTRKINDTELLKLIDAKTPRKEIGELFGCSQAAISKRLARLRPDNIEPLKIDSLTPKEKVFVTAIVSGETQTNSALKAYDVTTRDSAKALGSTLMSNKNIKEAIAEIREREIPLNHLVERLKDHIDSVDPTVSIRAIDMGLKLHDAYPVEKRMNLNVEVDIHPIDLSEYLNTR